VLSGSGRLSSNSTTANRSGKSVYQIVAGDGGARRGRDVGGCCAACSAAARVALLLSSLLIECKACLPMLAHVRVAQRDSRLRQLLAKLRQRRFNRLSHGCVGGYKKGAGHTFVQADGNAQWAELGRVQAQLGRL